ncbi:protein snet-1-like [Centruroides vittatus]|uniref:protein snet-1-like n=1 Tax=Centruroides vittatus TaxID=120091 RepID=UPI00350F87D5
MRWTGRMCLLLCYVVTVHALDCRKFVFAPLCRGISAKRSLPYPREISRHRPIQDPDRSVEPWRPAPPEMYAGAAADERTDGRMRQMREPSAEKWMRGGMVADY